MTEVPDNPFFETDACKGREFCDVCRTEQQFRDNLARVYKLDPNFECPFGITAADFPAKKPREEAKGPSLATRAVNATKAAGRLAQTLIAGEELLAPPEVVVNRLTKCFTCPDKQFKPSDQTCADCGCFIRAKIRLSTEKCPRGFWDKSAVTPRVTTIIKQAEGSDILEHEMELRKLYPVDGALAQAFNRYHAEKDTKRGCTNCWKNSMNRSLKQAFRMGFSTMSDEAKNKVLQLFTT